MQEILMSTQKERLVTLSTLVVLGLTTGLTYASSDGKSAEDLRLEPTAEDMAKARAERAKKVDDKANVYVSERGTVIRKNVDQNNHMKSVTVTPKETGIPYTMENETGKPIDNGPGANTRSTLGTPKFIEFTW